MIDIHTHILPGIDDGAPSLADSVEMCRRAAEDGCEVMIATPHQRHPHWWNDDRYQLASLRRELQEALGLRPRILEGGEIRVDNHWELIDELGSPGCGVCPLAGSRYVLVEFARNGLGHRPEETIHELLLKDWKPILAHPELLPWLAEDLPRLDRLVAQGARLQLTAMSLTGEFGRRPRENSHLMIHEGLAHFVASDCHGIDRRPPGLRRAFELVEQTWSSEVAQALFADNPGAIVADLPIPELLTASDLA